MILVSGGTGFIGAHLLLFLARNNESVRAIYRNKQSISKTKRLFALYSAKPEELLQNIEWFPADITDVTTLEKAFENVKKVYHTAAKVSFNPKNNDEMHLVNIEGTANMVNLAIENKIEKFIHLSSIAALGSYDNPISEKTHWNWKNYGSEYAVSKYLSEMEVWRATQEGLNAVILNPSVVLGAGFWNEGSGTIFTNIAKGLPFYAEGVVGFVDVWDLVKAMHQLMQSKIVNDSFIVSAENLSYQELFGKIAQCFDKKPPSIKLRKWMTALIWRAEFVRSKLFNTEPILTKSTAATAFRKTYYSSDKLKETLQFSFIPIDASIRNIVDKYPKKA
jgi:nucleoside-diphosphate-sugar epimerase